MKSTHAGLGDLILGVLQGILYSHLSNRTLIVDWKDTVYAPPDVNLFPELFELKVQSHSFNIAKQSDSVRPNIWKKYLDCSLDQMLKIHGRRWDLDACLKEFSIGMERVNYPESVVVIFGYRNFETLRLHFHNELAYLAKFTSSQILTNLAKQHLALDNALKGKAETWRQENLSGFTVGVHLRQTNEPGNKNTNLPRMHSELKRVLRIYPVDNIFLSTDNRNIVEEFSAEYRNVVWREKWLPKPNEPLHLTVGNSDAGITSAKDAVIDIYLLARCDILLYSRYSNFGFVSSLWSDNDKNIDLSPRSSKIRNILQKIKQRVI